MVDRFLVWLSAGVVTAGVSALPGLPRLAEPQLRVLHRADRRYRRCADRVLYRKCPPQTQRYLLTDGLRQATLLGSMCARVKDASQRPG